MSMKERRDSQNQNSFKQHCRRFVDHTTIHGFRDMFYATPKIVKFVWFVIVIICIAGAAYQITIMAMTYQHQPTTSHIYWRLRQFYSTPVVTFCPSKWVSFRSAKNMTLSNYTMMALKKAAFGHDGDDSDFAVVAKNLDDVLSARNTNLIQLYYDISHDADHFLECKKCEKIVKIYQQMNGVCYQFHFPPLDSKRLTVASFLDLVFSFDSPKSVADPEFILFDAVKESPKIAIGEAAISSVAFDSARLKLNRTYQLKIHVKRIKKLNKLTDPCQLEVGKHVNLNFGFASVDACALNCTGLLNGPFYHFCYLCARLRQKMNSIEFNSVHHPCSLERWKFNGNDTEECNVIRNYTFENCTLSPDCNPPSCEFYLYDYSLMVLAEERPKTIVHVFFRPIEGIETVKEIYTYSWETFLSNVGGQLGLWLGASVVSFFQIIYYCFHYCCTRSEWKRASSSASFRSNGSCGKPIYI